MSMMSSAEAASELDDCNERLSSRLGTTLATAWRMARHCRAGELAGGGAMAGHSRLQNRENEARGDVAALCKREELGKLPVYGVSSTNTPYYVYCIATGHHCQCNRRRMFLLVLFSRIPFTLHLHGSLPSEVCSLGNR